MKKELYSIRKSKAYGLCGVVLASVFLATGNVSADEVTPTNSQITQDVTLTENNSTNELNTSTAPEEVTQNANQVSEKIEDLATSDVRSYNEENIKETPIKLGEEVVDKGKVTNPNPTPNEPAKTNVTTTENKVTKAGPTDVVDPNPTVKLNSPVTNGSYTVELKEETKTSTETSTVVEHKPMDLVAIMDFSPSTSGGARKFWFENLKRIITADLSDTDHVTIALYGMNYKDSYLTGDLKQERTRDQGVLMDYYVNTERLMTNLLSKSDALKLVDALLADEKNLQEGRNVYDIYKGLGYKFPYQDIVDAVDELKSGLMKATNPSDPYSYTYKTLHEEFFKKWSSRMTIGYTTNMNANKGFEEWYEEMPNKNELVSVIQYTDGWNEDEDIDTTFAEWATKNAKTFMSAIFNGGSQTYNFIKPDPRFLVTNSEGKEEWVKVSRLKDGVSNTALAKSAISMQEAGHANIYDTFQIRPENFVSIYDYLTSKGYTIKNEFGQIENAKAWQTFVGTNAGKDEEEIHSDIVKQFENTGIEKTVTTPVTTVIKPKLSFNVASKDAKLNSVTLIKPDGSKETIEIKNNGTMAEFLEKEVEAGKYQIDWSAESPKSGSVLTLAFANGKEAVNDTKNLVGKSSVILKVLDENGKEIVNHRVAAGDIGSSYTIKEPTVGSGATLTKLSGDLSGKFEEKDKEVIFKVNPKAGVVTIKFVDESGKELADSVMIDASRDWTVSSDITNRSEITKDRITYDLIKSPKETSGKAGRDSVELTYVYSPRKVVRTVSIRLIDSNGNELLASTPVYKGYDGDAYEIKAPSAVGYEVTLTDGIESDSLKGSDVTLTYLARELAAPVNANYYIEGKDGQLIEVALKDLISNAKYTGEAFNFDKDIPKEIEVNGLRYVLVSRPKKISGVTLSQSQDLEYIYKRETAGKVIVKFVATDGKEIAKDIIISENGFTGDAWEYEGAPITIQFEGQTYTLLTSTEVLKGILSAEDIVLTFVYKMEVPTPQDQPNNEPIEKQTEIKNVSVAKNVFTNTSEKTLPNTGTDNSILSILGFSLVGLTTFFVKKRQD